MTVPEENPLQPAAGDLSPPVAAPNVPPVPIYAIAELSAELRQCEIITGLIQYAYRAETGDAEEVVHSYAIVLSQDCDLLRDYECKLQGKPRAINGVLVYEMQPEDVTRPTLAPGKETLKRVRQNKDERYQFFEAVPADLDLCGEGLPSLIVDFRRYFTVSPDEIYRQLGLSPPAAARRRCRLEMPFREHVQCRAAFYLQRVVLPRQHGE